MNTILRVHEVTKQFGGLKAVDTCTFAVPRNSITALIGPNGAGKTTMFDLISGFMKANEGQIFFNGEDIAKKEPHERTRLGLARTFQVIRIFPELSVIDNVLIGFQDNRERFRDIFRSFGKHTKQQRERAMELLRKINLERHASHYAAELSYGQQKLLEITRCMALGGELFLLDEPAAGVNRTMLRDVITIIQELKKNGKTILLVEHDMPFVMGISEKIIVMDRGREIAVGRPDEIQKNPHVLEAYLGGQHNHHEHAHAHH